MFSVLIPTQENADIEFIKQNKKNEMYFTYEVNFTSEVKVSRQI